MREQIQKQSHYAHGASGGSRLAQGKQIRKHVLRWQCGADRIQFQVPVLRSRNRLQYAMRVQADSKKAWQARADRRGNQGTQAVGKRGTGQTGYDHPSVQYRRVWHPCAGDRSSDTEIWEVSSDGYMRAITDRPYDHKHFGFRKTFTLHTYHIALK